MKWKLGEDRDLRNLNSVGNNGMDPHRVLLGLYGDNGKENGNYYNRVYWGYMGIIYLSLSLFSLSQKGSL